MEDYTNFLDVQCPRCDADAVVKAYSHQPGGPRFGYETLYSLQEKQCDCEWESKDAKAAVEVKYDDGRSSSGRAGCYVHVRLPMAVTSEGEQHSVYHGAGGNYGDDEDNIAWLKHHLETHCVTAASIVWVEAKIPVPEPPTVQAETCT